MQTLTVYNQHVLQALKQIPDNSVDCIITSPPYYGLRSYKGAETIWGGDPNCEHEFTIDWHKPRGGGDPVETTSVGNNRKIPNFEYDSVSCKKCGAWKGQLGLESTYQMYLEHLLMVTAELKRVLKPSGTLFWNMGDSYAGKMGKRQGWNDNKISYTREEALENGTTFYLSADYGNIQDKSLMLLPERFAIGMIDQGWILRNKIIWYKPNGLPSSVKDRLTNKWEYVFFFVKSKKYFFNLDAIRKPLADPDRILGAVSGNKPRPNIKHDLAVNRKGSYSDPLHTKPYNSKGANPGDVMDIPTKPHTFAHFAVFPETLVEPLIKAGCPQEVCSVCGKPKVPVYKFVGYVNVDERLANKPVIIKKYHKKLKEEVGISEHSSLITNVKKDYELVGYEPTCTCNASFKPAVVLDPFAGSGTTLLVALNHGLDAIGIEISKEYIPIIERRTNAKERQKFGTLDYRLIV